VILPVVLLLVVVGAVLGGADLTRLARVRVRWIPAILAALGIQIVIIRVLPASFPLGVAASIHVFTYGLAAAFLVVNRSVIGLWIIGVGGMLNLTAIVTNGGVMPATARAMAAAGMSDTAGFENSAVRAHAHFAFLGDVFATPKGVPLANVFSIGDVLIVLGTAALVWGICGRHADVEELPVGRPALASPLGW
jgi:hypothetical protein